MATNKKKYIRRLIPILAALLILGGTGVYLYGNTPTQIAVVSMPEQTLYEYGSELDTTGLTLELTRRNGRKEIITQGFTCSPTELNEAGTMEITVSLDGLTTSFAVESVPEVTGIYLLSGPIQSIFFPGDTFNPRGVSLEVFYSDGTNQRETTGFTVTGTPDMSTPGEHAVEMTYGEYTFTVPILVLPEVAFDNIRFFAASQCDDAGNGYNQSGENVNWTIMIPFDLPLETLQAYPPTISSSWSELIAPIFDLNESYSMAKSGVTSYEYFHYGSGESISGNPQAFLFLFLPDDPSIEGFQTFTIQVGPYTYTEHIELEYLGDYETGTGWYVWKA